MARSSGKKTGLKGRVAGGGKHATLGRASSPFLLLLVTLMMAGVMSVSLYSKNRLHLATKSRDLIAASHSSFLLKTEPEDDGVSKTHRTKPMQTLVCLFVHLDNDAI